jgi:hypothetical protein
VRQTYDSPLAADRISTNTTYMIPEIPDIVDRRL